VLLSFYVASGATPDTHPIDQSVGQACPQDCLTKKIC
jgi:hypothetical protein